ncbi:MULTISPECIES: hybrid sensor histidine kinase/response regulator [Caballeronia]|uniref:hybrid sensor histidine kinase/response regulator n=1 Tax=Caballeronia TaxID=1827195 RepID=UPI001EF6192A|nr:MULTISPECIES: hybrid sensor histidine kinase/response regulator [Caballeronia]MCG7400451.1 response regulator [Caballeronia zhejiangensis]
MPQRQTLQSSQGETNLIARSHFRLTRKVLISALTLTVIGPCIFLAVVGWEDWQDRLLAARDTTERSTYIAEEHAQKVFDIDSALAARVLDTLQEHSRVAFVRDERNRGFYEYLRRLVNGYSQVDALSVWTADGRLAATSVAYPTPDLSIVDRADFRDASANPTKLYVSGPLKGRVTGNATFNVMKGDVRADGMFAGVVSISMSAAYFENFYSQLADDNPITFGLIRGDGAVLAWAPRAAARPERISRDTPFYRMLSSGRDAGMVRMVSSVDGEEKVLAFRRVGNYDAFVTSGIAISSLRSSWFVQFLRVALATAVPSAALLFLLIFSLRRLGREERLWRLAEEQSAMRSSVESAARESQRLETLGNMVALVAHDFNNLLMAILGYAHAEARANPKGGSSATKGIVDTVQRGQRLTRRLLSVSRKQPVRPETVDLADSSSAIALLRSAVGEGVVVVLQVEQGLWNIHVDRAEFELALLNIAINARDAMAGRGRLLLEMTNVGPSGNELGSPLGTEFVRIALTDNGKGIDPSTVERAFEPFFSTKPPGQGTGLGLSQVQAFCELSGGHCSIAAAAGGGTVVSLFLPRARCRSTQKESRSADSPMPDKPFESINLLVVEDDEMVADAQAAMFSALGYEVSLASTADEAYRLLQPPHDFDAVISDVQMPGHMTGIDLAEHLQQSQPELPLLMLTGFVDQAERLRQLGVTAFLKPVVDIGALDEWLRRRVDTALRRTDTAMKNNSKPHGLTGQR